MFDGFGERVRLQESPNAGLELVRRSQDVRQVTEWINTFRHADVVINLSSTVTVDAAIFDKPVVNLDFDPQPSRDDQQLVKDINHKWNHFRPIAESGGVWLVNDIDEMVDAVRTYLRHPELHREQRQWIAEYVCGHVDGRCGERMAAAIHDFARQCERERSQSR
jgi:CDP-glycerol glycerophosphotransferase (TagB/SpsB family)